MMTEKEAWLHMAETWSNPKCDGVGHYYVLQDCYGLCVFIEHLRNHRQIYFETYALMLTRLAIARVELQKYVWSFYWPRDANGAKTRVEFCKTQAEKLNVE